MMRIQGRRDGEFTEGLARVAIKKDQSTIETASRDGVQPNRVIQMKKRIQEALPEKCTEPVRRRERIGKKSSDCCTVRSGNSR